MGSDNTRWPRPEPPDDAAERGDAVAGEDTDPKILTAVSGSFVTLPTGERIFLLDDDDPEVEATPAGAGGAAGWTAPPMDSDAVSAPEEIPPARPAAVEAPSRSEPLEPVPGPRSSWPHSWARSEEVDELITDVPSWLVRWGIVVVFAVLVTLLTLAWVVRYPEVVSGTVTVTTGSPPLRLMTSDSGEVQALLAQDGAPVAAGDWLLVFRSGAAYRDVQRLQAGVEALLPALQSAGVESWQPPQGLALGPLEVPYSNLARAIAEYEAYRTDPFRQGLFASFEKQIRDEQRLRTSLEARLRLLSDEARIAEEERLRAAALAGSGLLSQQDLAQADTDLLRSRGALEAIQAELVTSDVRVSQIQSQWLEARQRDDEQERNLRRAVRASVHALRSAIEQWREQYVMVAPAAGRVTFLRNLAEGQFITAMEPTLAIVPSDDRITATVLLSSVGAGRVQVGQHAILHFDSFPSAQFGTVEGRVESISLVTDQPSSNSANGAYLLRLSLPHGLETSYGGQLELRHEMGGVANIVTQDRRVLERMFQQVYDLVTRSTLEKS